MTPVALSDEAELDLEGIGDYIALDSPLRAIGFIADLRAACMRIGLAPMATTARPELGENLRCRPFGHYLIFLQVEAERVLIVRVLHGARDVSTIFAPMDDAESH